MKTVAALTTAVLTAVILVGGGVSADDSISPAPEIPTPCDFITGGGFILSPLTMHKANFGAHGGCKHGDFWGHVNYVDHGDVMGKKPFHVRSTEITGYFIDPASPANGRIICGVARTNVDDSPVPFRVVMRDEGEPGTADLFEIELGPPTPYAAAGFLLGGDIKLHKPNPSTTTPQLDEIPTCPGLGGGLPAPE